MFCLLSYIYLLWPGLWHRCFASRLIDFLGMQLLEASRVYSLSVTLLGSRPGSSPDGLGVLLLGFCSGELTLGEGPVLWLRPKSFQHHLTPKSEDIHRYYRLPKKQLTNESHGLLVFLFL